ncbi:hypothetical protein ACEUAG_11450 [Aeromonas hydrophila]|nr:MULTISPECIES: hypothetical protein [Aeromonas]MCR3907575.1 hypothetical protein [Aeromonas hydrophila]MED7773211.1 hypothetical protein [Aeromonas dhakensis]
MIYKKGMPEHRANGKYEINGVMWYSIWTFKKEKGILNSSNKVNENDAIMLSSLTGNNYILIEPEIGGFETVRGFREDHLMKFYKQ